VVRNAIMKPEVPMVARMDPRAILVPNGHLS
jgi:hypothetical protein